MNNIGEKRKEQRLHYDWPVWFAEDFGKPLFKGQMFDISSNGASFVCDTSEGYPYLGRQITTLLSIPRLGSNMANLIRIGRVCRIDEDDISSRRVAVKFEEPLSFKPSEESEPLTLCTN